MINNNNNKRKIEENDNINVNVFNVLYTILNEEMMAFLSNKYDIHTCT